MGLPRKDKERMEKETMKLVSLSNGIQDASLEEFLGGHYGDFPYAFFMFYPKDFTFVCPTEVLELNSLVDQFEELGCKPYAISSDSPYCHEAWLKTPTMIGGLGGMVDQLTLVSDEDFELANEFCAKNGALPEMKRVSVIYDRTAGSTIYYLQNPGDVGRNIEDAVRVLRQFRELEGKPDHFCPKKSLSALRKEAGVFPELIAQ